MTAIVIAALVVTLLLMLVVVVLAALKGKAAKLKNQAPGPKWSFSSWATTLTATGGVLATILAGASFPDHPDQIGKDSLVGISLLFAGLVVVAPFVFQALRNPSASSTDQERGRWGWNWSLLLACSITGGAVLGELACVSLLSHELIGSTFWQAVALVALGLLALLALYYTVVTAYQLATSEWTVTPGTVGAVDGVQSIVIGTAAADGGGEEPGQVEVTVSPVQGGWNLP